MEYPSDEEVNRRNAVPSISLEIKKPKHTTSIERENPYPRKEESGKSSRVKETLADERIVYNKKFSLDRKFNDQRRFFDVVSTFYSPPSVPVKTRKLSKSKKIKNRQQGLKEIRKYHDGREHGDVESKCELFLDTKNQSKKLLVPPNCTPIVNEGGDDEMLDLTHSLSGSDLKDMKDRLAVKVPVEVKEYDKDVIEAAETLMMMRYGRSSMAESSTKKKCLSFDLNKTPATSPDR